MSDEIVFYHNPQSRSVMAHWMLEEAGAPYRVVEMDWSKDPTRQPDYLAVNPMGKIPAIQHRGVTVTETPAIMAYLADAFPEANLAPPVSSPSRGAYYRWLFFGAACIEPSALDVMMKRGDPQKRSAGYGSYDDVIKTLRETLSTRNYLVDDRFTAADCYTASELSFLGLFGAPNIKGDPIFDAYVARCTDRPAYRRSQGAAVESLGAAG